MVGVMDIRVSKVHKSKISEIDFNDLPFGKYFTDHMLEADFINGSWQAPVIRPYQALQLEPSVVALHYGQAIFEGMKAYRNEEGDAYIFRPRENFRRFNISADRMAMPTIPEEIFLEGMRLLIETDRAWIPSKKDYSLYIRPLMFATDQMIGVRPSETYKFLILLSPTGPYYPAPMKIYVEEKYTRAAPGGVGFAKNAGNYGASLKAFAEARAKGYDQVLWTDAFEHGWLQEVGTMNVFFVIGNTVVTPPLDEGTILAGVTRDSAITLIREMGLKMEERNIHIRELMDAYRKGEFREVFGTGTAATVSFIKELRYKDFQMHFDTVSWKIGPELKKTLGDIREGRVPDTHQWMTKV